MDQQPTQPMGPFGRPPDQPPAGASGRAPMSRSRKAKVVGTVAAVGLIGALAAGGVAWAGGALGGGQGGDKQTYGIEPAALTGPESPEPTKAPKPGERLKHGLPGRFGIGIGLHGEFVVKQSDGSGYQTVATQVGEVTAVSSSSITLKSEDGYSRTYTVTADTLVNSTRDGISAVKKGDQVRVFATVADEKATAVQVADVTGRKDAMEKWGFGKHR